MGAQFETWFSPPPCCQDEYSVFSPWGGDVRSMVYHSAVTLSSPGNGELHPTTWASFICPLYLVLSSWHEQPVACYFLHSWWMDYSSLHCFAGNCHVGPSANPGWILYERRTVWLSSKPGRLQCKYLNKRPDIFLCSIFSQHGEVDDIWPSSYSTSLFANVAHCGFLFLVSSFLLLK